MFEANTVMGESGFDYILENFADENLADDLSVLAPGGKIAVRCFLLI